MKKRILSFVLAAMMVVMVFAIPTTVAGAVSNNYSYKFEDTDIRNIVDGQVFDVAAKGESEKAPTMDGKINEGEYAISGTIARETNENAHASLPIHFAVKDGYMYVAFKYEGEKQQARLQLELGILQDHRSDGAYSRKQVVWGSDDSVLDTTYLLRIPGTNDWANDGRVNMDSDLFLVDKKHNADGTYEAKFDLSAFYNVFENSCRGVDIYESPCVVFSMFYDVDAKTEVGQTHYAYPVAGGVKIDSATNATWVPATIIIPQHSLDIICKKNIGIGEFGKDPRNMIEGQLASVKEYAASIPSLDGKVSDGEYTVMNHVINNTNSAFTNPIYASYSVSDDGYIYVALSYKIDAQPASIHFQYGITGNNYTSMISRVRASLKSNGTYSYSTPLFGNPNKAGVFSSLTFTTDQQKAQYSIDGYATSYKDGVATYEVKIDIATMVSAYEMAGWDADYANCFTFMLWPDNNNQVAYRTTDEQENVIKAHNGLGYVPGGNYTSPTVELPEGTTSKFHKHVSDAVTVVKEATHYEDGLIKYVCDKCGEQIEEIVPRNLVHDYNTPEKHNADFHQIDCDCGFSYYEDHEWNKGEVLVAATKTERGTMKYTCTVCGETRLEVIPVLTDAFTAPATTTTTSRYPKPVEPETTTTAPATETTPAPTTTEEPTTTPAPTTPAPTTTAEPTKKPAETTANESNGCGGMIGLSALALVPMLGAAVVFGKKRED